MLHVHFHNRPVPINAAATFLIVWILLGTGAVLLNHTNHKKTTPPLLGGVVFWRRVRDSNPRFLSESPVFKTGSLNRSDNSPFVWCIISFIWRIVKVNILSALRGRKSVYKDKKSFYANIVIENIKSCVIMMVQDIYRISK